MTDSTITTKQPSGTGLDYADPTKFKFQMVKLPLVEFNTVAAQIPDVSLSELNQPTRLQQLKIPGNDMTFSDLTITFLVDEELQNYRKVHEWMAALAQVDGDEKFQALLAEGQDRMPNSQTRGIQSEPGKSGLATPDGAIYSDAKLVHLTNRNIPKVEISFRDCYPKALSAIEYNQNNTDVEYITAQVTFGYKYHEYSTPF
ncbi:tail completion protein [Pelagibacter phage HTVC008M]|jgi:hypothetical protein|uniref:tail completion protein n=1 Tax=Pelagibacter phage HTVC008M TaxID=1283076 RepID=UPI0002B28C47|nr:tail completion protein [Pelagibacter phage HTVC008M]AGE60427.1 tail completion protein [Pelagibacter phage HTVC008M]